MANLSCRKYDMSTCYAVILVLTIVQVLLYRIDKSVSHERVELVKTQHNLSAQQITDQINSSSKTSVSIQQTVDPIKTNVSTQQTVDPINTNVSTQKTADQINSSAGVSAQQVTDPIKTNVSTQQTVDPIKTNVSTQQIADQINTNVSTEKTADQINSSTGVSAQQITDPIKTNVSTQQIADQINTNVSTQKTANQINSSTSVSALLPTPPALNNNEKNKLRSVNCACKHIVQHHRCPSCASWDYEDMWGGLKGAKILLMGDSLSWQLLMAMLCTAPEEHDNIIKYELLHVFPFEEAMFENVLEEMISSQNWSAVVFGTGSWYNWDWSDSSSISNINANTTLQLLIEHCPKALHSYLVKEKGVYNRAKKIRQLCKLLLRRDSYVSGLMRLKNVLQRHPSWPPVIWKEIPPQHFRTPSGQYDYEGPQKRKGCVPIQNLSMAYSRNIVANEVLKNSVAFVRTWDNDVDAWNQHLRNVDCTHYCNPSPTTWNWVRLTVRAIENVLLK